LRTGTEKKIEKKLEKFPIDIFLFFFVWCYGMNLPSINWKDFALMYPICSEYLERRMVLEVMRGHFSIADSIVIKYWSINGQSEDLEFELASYVVFDKDGKGRTSQ